MALKSEILISKSKTISNHKSHNFQNRFKYFNFEKFMIYLEISDLNLEFCYLYLSASNGSILLARRAGTSPVKNPTMAENAIIDNTNQRGL